VIPTEWDSDLDEIFGRYLLFWEAEAIALGPPEADPDYPPLEGLLGEQAYSEVVERAQSYRDNQLVLVVPEGSIGDHIVRLPNPAPLAKEEDREVVIQDCWIQDDEQHSLDGEVAQETKRSILFNVRMRVIEAEWRVAAITPASDESSGYRECTDYIDFLDSSPPCQRCWPYGQE
jgi:hypothetical protein